ncbi:hypothetical protein V5O48_009377 [Marasmius crinis-equi]|uniref:Uncharacterized protein n=1 Tax=Marasmius crinis-equi TaxID=585013 RepID=A0ABR3FBU3_9AGAR
MARWVEFFLQNVILSREIMTPEGRDAVEYSVVCIPTLLDFRGEDACFVKHESPHMVQLIPQVLFFLIDLSHQHWGPWAALSTTLARSTCTHNSSYKPARPIRMVYPEKQQLGLILIRHLALLARRVPKMDKQELSHLKSYTMLISIADQAPFKSNPIFLSSNRKYFVATLTYLLRRLVRRKSFQQASDEFKLANEIVLLIFASLFWFMKDRDMVEKILDTKLVTAILRSGTPFLRSKTQAMDTCFVEWCTRIVDQVAIFVLYKPIARRVSSFSKKAAALTSEGLARMRSEGGAPGERFVDAWRNLMAKAAISKQHHRDMKEMVICSYPMKGPKLDIFAVLDARLTRCTAHVPAGSWTGKILTAFNVPLLPGKSPADVKHALDENFQFTIRYDLVSFEEWMKSYVRAHAMVILAKWEVYMSSIKHESETSTRPLAEDRKAILEGRKQPVLFLDFDRPQIPDPEDPNCVQFIDMKLVKTHIVPRYSWGPERAVSMMDRWLHDPGVNESKLYLWGPYPNTRERTWMIFDVVEFPLGVNRAGCEGYYKDLEHATIRQVLATAGI